MKKCTKCGHQVNGPIHYCPYCGTLLPGEKEQELIASVDYKRLKDSANNAPIGWILYDKEKYEDAVRFYEQHLQQGYAPSGKVLLSDAEFYKMKADNAEFENLKKKHGTHEEFFGYGDYLHHTLPNYDVKQSTENRIVNLTFSKYWHRKYKELEKWQQLLVRLTIWLLSLSAFFSMIFGGFRMASIEPFWLSLLLVFLWLGVLFVGCLFILIGVNDEVFGI